MSTAYFVTAFSIERSYLLMNCAMVCGPVHVGEWYVRRLHCDGRWRRSPRRRGSVWYVITWVESLSR